MDLFESSTSGISSKALDLAKKVRSAITNEERVHEESTLAGLCGLATYVLGKVYQAHGLEVRMVVAGKGSHCWLEHDGHVVDLTATQFSRSKYFGEFQYPPVYVAPIAEYKLTPQFSHYGVEYGDAAEQEIIRNWGVRIKNGYQKVIDGLGPSKV